MNKTKSIIRIAILLALGMFAVIFILGEEQNNSMIRIIADKTLGVGAVYLMVRLYSCWRKTDRWLMAYDRLCYGELEKTNPMLLDNDNEG